MASNELFRLGIWNQSTARLCGSCAKLAVISQSTERLRLNIPSGNDAWTLIFAQRLPCNQFIATKRLMLPSFLVTFSHLYLHLGMKLNTAEEFESIHSPSKTLTIGQNSLLVNMRPGQQTVCEPLGKRTLRLHDLGLLAVRGPLRCTSWQVEQETRNFIRLEPRYTQTQKRR